MVTFKHKSKMSFQSTADRPPTIPLHTNISNFESRWSTVVKNMPNTTDEIILRRTRTLVKELDTLQALIIKRLETYAEGDKTSLQSKFNVTNEQFTLRREQILKIMDQREDEMKYNTISSAPPPQHSQGISAKPSSSSASSTSLNKNNSKNGGSKNNGKLLAQPLLVEGDFQLEYINNEAADIADQMQMLNKVTHQVDGHIQDQHKTIIKIDGTIEDAKEEMVLGNSDLLDAEKDQKSSSKIVLIIAAIVIGVVLVIAGGVCLYLFVFKKK